MEAWQFLVIFVILFTVWGLGYRKGKLVAGARKYETAHSEDNIENPRDYQDHYTVERLLEFIKENEIPMDAKILAQRIEDVYFEQHGWATIKKGGYWYNYGIRFNADIESGKYLDKEQYPQIIKRYYKKHFKKISEKDLEKSKEEYHPIWCPVKYKNDDNLYMDLHY